MKANPVKYEWYTGHPLPSPSKTTLEERIEIRYRARIERLRRRDSRDLCPTCGQKRPLIGGGHNG